MNQRIRIFASRLQYMGVLLIFFAALRADGHLRFWLAPALLGTGLAAGGLGLGWLCSNSGLDFRRRAFGTPSPAPAAPCRAPIPFPKAG